MAFRRPASIVALCFFLAPAAPAHADWNIVGMYDDWTLIENKSTFDQSAKYDLMVVGDSDSDLLRVGCDPKAGTYVIAVFSPGLPKGGATPLTALSARTSAGSNLDLSGIALPNSVAFGTAPEQATSLASFKTLLAELEKTADAEIAFSFPAVGDSRFPIAGFHEAEQALVAKCGFAAPK